MKFNQTMIKRNNTIFSIVSDITSKLNTVLEKISVLENRILYIPTKDEFFTREDQIMGELKNIRDEQVAANFRLSQHSDQINALEEIHTHSSH